MKKLIAIFVGLGGAGAFAFAGCSGQPRSSCFNQGGDIFAPFYAKYTVLSSDDANTGGCAFLGQHMEDGKLVVSDSIGVVPLGSGSSLGIALQPLAIAGGEPAADGSLTAVGDFNGDPDVCEATTLSPISALVPDPNLTGFPEGFPRIGRASQSLAPSSSDSGSSSGSSSDSGSSSGSTGGSSGTSSSSTSGSSGTSSSSSASSSSSSSASASTGSSGSSSSSSTSAGSSGSTGASGSSGSGSSGGDTAGAAPMVQATYTFSNVKFVQAGNIPGTEFTAELQYDQMPVDPGATECHATIHVQAIWYDNSSLNTWPDGGTPTDIISTGSDGTAVDHGFIANHCDVDADCASSAFNLPGGGSDFECLQMIQPNSSLVPCEADKETKAACEANALLDEPAEDVCVCGLPDHCVVTDTAAGTGYCGETQWDGGAGNPARCVPKTMPAGATDCQTNCEP